MEEFYIIPPGKIFTNVYYDYMNSIPIPQTDLDKNSTLVQNPGY